MKLCVFIVILLPYLTKMSHGMDRSAAEKVGSGQNKSGKVRRTFLPQSASSSQSSLQPAHAQQQQPHQQQHQQQLQPHQQQHQQQLQPHQQQHQQQLQPHQQQHQQQLQSHQQQHQQQLQPHQQQHRLVLLGDDTPFAVPKQQTTNTVPVPMTHPNFGKIDLYALSTQNSAGDRVQQSRTHVGGLPALQIANSLTENNPTTTTQPNRRGTLLAISEPIGQQQRKEEKHQNDQTEQPIIQKQQRYIHPTVHLLKLKEPMDDADIGREKEGILWRKIDALNQQIGGTAPMMNMRNFVTHIWQLFALTFLILGLEPNSIEQAKTEILQNSLDLVQLRLAIYQSNPGVILARIKTLLVENEHMKKSPILANIFFQINNLAKGVFGQPLFDLIGDESEEMKRLKVFYFYTMLYRKLLGSLETPFSGKPPQILAEENSQRKVLLFWMGKARREIGNEFETIVRATKRIVDGQQKINQMKILDELEVASERMRLAIFVVYQTVVAALWPRVAYSKLFDKLDSLLSKNIVCVMLNRETIDLNRVAKASARGPDSMGVTATFLRRLFTALQQHQEEIGQNGRRFPVARVANVFLKMFRAAIVDLSFPHPFVRAENKAKLMAFLNGSVAQLDKFVGQWKGAIEGMVFREESEKGFISDYLLENCIPYMAKKAAKRQKQRLTAATPPPPPPPTAHKSAPAERQ